MEKALVCDAGNDFFKVTDLREDFEHSSALIYANQRSQEKRVTEGETR